MRDVFLHVDSRMRIDPRHTNHGRYTIQLKNMLHGVRGVALTTLELPNTFATFTPNTNTARLRIWRLNAAGVAAATVNPLPPVTPLVSFSSPPTVPPPPDPQYWEPFDITFTFPSSGIFAIWDIIAQMNVTYAGAVGPFHEAPVSDVLFGNDGARLFAKASYSDERVRPWFQWLTTNIVIGVDKMDAPVDLVNPWVSAVGMDVTVNTRLAFLTIQTRPDAMRGSELTVADCIESEYAAVRDLYPNVHMHAFARIPISQSAYDMVYVTTTLPGQEMFRWQARGSERLSIGEMTFTWFAADGSVARLVDATQTMLLRFTLDA